MPTVARMPKKRTPRQLPHAAQTAVLDVFDSDLGWIVISTTEQRLLGVVFGYPRKTDALEAARSRGMTGVAAGRNGETDDDAWRADLRARFISFAAGQFEDFRDIEIDDSHLTPFERSIVKACRAIPYGETLAYGQLATKAGRDGAARAVGRVMATNRYPLVVPCHRVLASGGKLGGYSAPEGLALKRRLLAMEAGDGPALFTK